MTGVPDYQDQELGKWLVAKHDRWVPFVYSLLYGEGYLTPPFAGVLNETLDKVFTGEITRLIVSIAPRMGKTLTCVWALISRAYAINPGSNIIHTSFGQSLVNSNSMVIRDIIQSSDFQRLFPHVSFAKDAKSKGHWKTLAGGQFLAATSGSGITGHGAGVLGYPGFSGCFPYHQTIITEHGIRAIGELVESRERCRVWSFNTDTGKAELQPIEKHFVNPPNRLVTVHLSDGTQFQCTPDHEIYTGSDWVRADQLQTGDAVPSLDTAPILNGTDSQTGQLCSVSAFQRSVARYSELFYCRSRPVLPVAGAEVSGRATPCFSGFNLPDNAFANVVAALQHGGGIGGQKDFTRLQPVQLGAGSHFHDRESAVSFGVSDILSARAISEIFQRVVQVVAIKVPDLMTFRARAYKSLYDQRMNRTRFYPAVTAEIHEHIAMAVSVLLERFTLECIALHRLAAGSRLCGNSACEASDNAGIAHLVKPDITEYRAVLNVVDAGHADKTYCLQVKGNHNFTLTNGAIVSNCLVVDDPNKPDDMASERITTQVNSRWSSTLVHRLANRFGSNKTPVIVVQQRLGENDFTGELLDRSGALEDWHHLVLPTYIEEDYTYTQSGTYIRHSLPSGSIWPARVPDKLAKRLCDSRQTRNSIQHTQEPSADAGDCFERDWFNRYEKLPSNIKSWSIWCDTASKDNKYSDWTVFQLWAKTTDNKGYLVRQWRKKEQVPYIKKRFITFYTDACELSGIKAKSSRLKVGIEDKDSGVGLIQALKAEGYSIKAISRSAGKYARALDASDHVRRGEIYIPKGEQGDTVIAECVKFKADDSHAHDDCVDPLVDFINHELPKSIEIDTFDAEDLGVIV